MRRAFPRVGCPCHGGSGMGQALEARAGNHRRTKLRHTGSLVLVVVVVLMSPGHLIAAAAQPGPSVPPVDGARASALHSAADTPHPFGLFESYGSPDAAASAPAGRLALASSPDGSEAWSLAAADAGAPSSLYRFAAGFWRECAQGVSREQRCGGLADLSPQSLVLEDLAPVPDGAAPLEAVAVGWAPADPAIPGSRDRKSTRLNSSHGYISYAVFCLKKKK